MNLDDLKYYIYADLYRAYGKSGFKIMLKTLLGLKSYGAKYVVHMRILRYLKLNNKNIVYKILFKLLYIRFRKLQLKYGIRIEPFSDIGEGVSIPHCGNIVFGTNARLGKNCTILQGTTIGSNLFKSRNELATIGDNVLIGAGSKIIGTIKIGNNVTIGANSVVTKDIPDDVVIAGNPAKIISHKKAIEINCDYVSREYFLKSNKCVN